MEGTFLLELLSHTLSASTDQRGAAETKLSEVPFPSLKSFTLISIESLSL